MEKIFNDFHVQKTSERNHYRLDILIRFKQQDKLIVSIFLLFKETKLFHDHI